MTGSFRLWPVLIVVASMLVSPASSEINVESPEEIQTVLFAAEGPLLEPISPTRTLELLKHLRQHYESRSDKESIDRKKQLEMLISASIGTKEKCEMRTMVLFWRSILTTYFAHSLNIVPYLRVYRIKQFLACRDILAENLELDLAKLSKNQVSNMSLFRELYVQCSQTSELTTIINWPYSYDPVEELKCSIIDFVQQRGSKPDNEDKAKLKQLLHTEVEKVFEMCSSLLTTLKPSMDSYDVYMFNPNPDLFGVYDIKELQNKIDKIQIEWIASIKICNKMLIDKTPLLEGAVNMLAKRINESPVFWLKNNSSR